VYLLSNVRWKIIQALHGRYWRGGYFGPYPVYIQEPKLAGVPITILWWDHTHWNACSVKQACRNDPDLPTFLARGLVLADNDLFELQLVEWHVPSLATEALGCMIIVSGGDYLNTHIQHQLAEVQNLRVDVAEQVLATQAMEKKYHAFADFYCYQEEDSSGKMVFYDHPWLCQAKGKKGADHVAAQEAGYRKGHTVGKAEGKGKGNSSYRSGWDQGHGKGWSKGFQEGSQEGWEAGKAHARAGKAQGKGAQGAEKGKGPYIPAWTSKSGWCNKMINLLGNIKLGRWREVNRLVEVCLGCKFDI
jgi:hypothetical protein